MRHRLEPLGRGECEAYIRHRLTVAGWRGLPQIEPAAPQAVYRYSGGCPPARQRHLRPGPAGGLQRRGQPRGQGRASPRPGGACGRSTPHRRALTPGAPAPAGPAQTGPALGGGRSAGGPPGCGWLVAIAGLPGRRPGRPAKTPSRRRRREQRPGGRPGRAIKVDQEPAARPWRTWRPGAG